MPNFQPKDVIAAITIIGVFVLKALGHNSYVDTAGALILGYYFAHRKNGTDSGV